jgi:acyl carrier protein phosphodiesterase
MSIGTKQRNYNMNFLAHLFLSGNSEGLIIGNFIADSVKGSDYKKYPPEIQKGILLHRMIDTFTDTHPVVEESKKRLRLKYRKYSSVIVDIYYDHYLAINWNNYSNTKLDNYTQNIYKIIQKNHSILPGKSAEFAKYMFRYNILEAYSTFSGIEQVLKGMAGRAKIESNMELAIEDLKEHYTLFEKEFIDFFKELQEFVNSKV